MVAEVKYLLGHSMHFMAEDYGILLSKGDSEVLKLSAALHLFCSNNEIAVNSKLFNGIKRIIPICPKDGLRGAQCCLVDLAVRWCCRDAAQMDGLNGKSITGTEYGTHVMETAHVVQHDNCRQPLRKGEFF